MLDISIQIVNYKTKKYLKDCVDSVIHDLENTRILYKILILENGSGEDLSDSSKKEKVEYFKQSRRYFYKKWYGEEKSNKMLLKEENPENDKHLERVL